MEQGRLVAEQKTIQAQTYNLGFTYDANGALTSIVYPFGHVVLYDRADDDPHKLAELKEAERLWRSVTTGKLDEAFLLELRADVAAAERYRSRRQKSWN